MVTGCIKIKSQSIPAGIVKTLKKIKKKIKMNSIITGGRALMKIPIETLKRCESIKNFFMDNHKPRNMVELKERLKTIWSTMKP